MFYIVRFNASLASLGIDPTRVNSEIRSFAQNMGKKMGLSPQEAVLLTITQFPPNVQAEIQPDLVQTWVDDGKINMDKQTVQDALESLGWLLKPKGW